MLVIIETDHKIVMLINFINICCLPFDTQLHSFTREAVVTVPVCGTAFSVDRLLLVMCNQIILWVATSEPT